MKWVGEHLIERAEKAKTPMQPYTMEEIDAMLEESERDFEAGRCYSTDEVLKMCKGSLLQMETAWRSLGQNGLRNQRKPPQPIFIKSSEDKQAKNSFWK